MQFFTFGDWKNSKTLRIDAVTILISIDTNQCTLEGDNNQTQIETKNF